MGPIHHQFQHVLFYDIVSNEISAYYIEDIWGSGTAELGGNYALTMQWTVSGFLNNTQRTGMCLTALYLGGPGLQAASGSMERTYTGFTAHNMIYYSILFIMGGGWTSSDTFTLELDGNVIKVFSLAWALTQFAADTCVGMTPKVLKSYIVGKKLHSNTSLTLKLSWNATNNVTYPPFLAIKDVNFSFTQKKINDTEEVYVTLANTNNTISTGCAGAKYKDLSTKTCKSCVSPCATCFGNLPTQCYQTAWGTTFNGTAAVACYTGCGNCWGPGSDQCYHCNNAYSLAPDNTCKTSCTSPYVSFVTGNAKICLIPCNSSQFMSWNNTCVDSCDSPLITTNSSQGLMCNYPCGQSASNFLYWNGSCLPTCTFYTRDENNYRFCDACPPGYYMYANTTCSPECDPKLNTTAILNSNFCLNPCNSTEYLYPNKSCQSTCAAEFIQEIENGSYYCDYKVRVEVNQTAQMNQSTQLNQTTQANQTIQANQTAQVNQTTQANQTTQTNQTAQVNTTPQTNETTEIKTITAEVKTITVAQQVFGSVTTAVSSILSAVNFANPAAIFMAIMTRMLKNFRYLNINYSPKLQAILDANDDFLINITPNMPNNWMIKFSNSTLPSNFRKYDFPSNFCVNFWADEIALALLLITIILVYSLEHVPKRYRIAYLFNTKLKHMLKWNLTISLVISYFGDIVLFSSFEFRTNQLDNKYAIASFSLCIFVNILVVAIMVKTLLVIQAFRKSARRNIFFNYNSMLENAKWRSYKVVLECFNRETFWQQAFLPLSSLRVYFFYIIIAYLCDYPLIQMCLITGLNVIMVLYIIYKRPLKHKIDFAEYLVREFIMLIANLCVSALAIMDKANSHNQRTRNIMGEVLIWINTSFCSAASLYLCIKLIVTTILSIRNTINKSKKIKANSSLRPIEALRETKNRSVMSKSNLELASPELSETIPAPPQMKQNNEFNLQPSNNESLIHLNPNVASPFRYLSILNKSDKSQRQILTNLNESLVISNCENDEKCVIKIQHASVKESLAMQPPNDETYIHLNPTIASLSRNSSILNQLNQSQQQVVTNLNESPVISKYKNDEKDVIKLQSASFEEPLAKRRNKEINS